MHAGLWKLNIPQTICEVSNTQRHAVESKLTEHQRTRCLWKAHLQQKLKKKRKRKSWKIVRAAKKQEKSAKVEKRKRKRKIFLPAGTWKSSNFAQFRAKFSFCTVIDCWSWQASDFENRWWWMKIDFDWTSAIKHANLHHLKRKSENVDVMIIIHWEMAINTNYTNGWSGWYETIYRSKS